MKAALKNIKIDTETHKLLRIEAAKTGLTIQDCLRNILIKKLNTEKRRD